MTILKERLVYREKNSGRRRDAEANPWRWGEWGEEGGERGLHRQELQKIMEMKKETYGEKTKAEELSRM